MHKEFSVSVCHGTEGFGGDLADPDVARHAHWCKTFDLGKGSEVAGSSTGEAEHN